MSAVFSPEEPLLPDPEVAQLRIPPHSLEAEASVIGGLLLDNSAWDRVGDLLNEQDFYRYEHRQVFASVSALITPAVPPMSSPFMSICSLWVKPKRWAVWPT